MQVVNGMVFDITPIPENLGNCYELSAEYAVYGDVDGPFPTYPEDHVLVHGTIQGFGNPPIGHAWVETPEGVWEPATAKVFPAWAFKALYNPTVHVKYKGIEAARNMVSHGHYGPWD